jgi:hypothetical protein
MPSQAKKTSAGRTGRRHGKAAVEGVSHEVLGSSAADREREPEMPHERDQTPPDAQSSNAAAAPGNEVMRRAHDDVASGKKDTDRGVVTDETYHRLRKGAK